ncbi:hypothetical protein [Sinomicrobium sp. M5D2P17]
MKEIKDNSPIVYYIFLSGFLLFSSCNNKTKKKEEKNSTSQIEIKLPDSLQMNTEMSEDSIWRKNFHKNGKIKSEGKIIHEDFPIGEWKYYNEEGVLQEIKEIKNIGGKPHLNRNWVFDNKGDTIPNKSNYYTIQYDNDTISLGRPIQAVISLKEPLFKDKNSMVMVVVPKDYSKNFNKDFSNIEEVETDTTRNLNIETDIKKAFKMEGNYPWTVIFGRYYDTPGPKKFRGIIVEYYYTENHVPDSLNHNYYEHRSYFEKDVYIKDTIH